VPPPLPRLDLRAVGAGVRAVIEAPLGAAGFALEDVIVSVAGRRLVVRVAVDRDEGVLDLDSVADAARLAGDALDAVEGTPAALPVEYVLEVGSPGVERPLTLPRHWRRAVGRLVRVTLRAGGSVTGRVGETDDVAVRLWVADAVQTLSYGDIARAVVQVEMSRPAGDDTGTDSDSDLDEDGLDDDDLDEDGLEAPHHDTVLGDEVGQEDA